MKQITKLAALLLAMLLMAAVLWMPAAAEALPSGLELTLTTDKTAYAQGDSIVATLTAKNVGTTP